MEERRHEAERSPLLEREREVTALREALAAARAGEGSIVLLSGPAGIGKTRLLQEARLLSRGLDLRALVARGGEVERDLPWGLARQALDPALAALSSAERGELFADAGGLASAVFGANPPTASGPSAVAALIYGLYWILVGLAAHRPAALLVDDAQWGDEESLRWLSFLAPRLAGLPVALLVVVRSGDPDAAREPLVRFAASDGATTLRPRPLSAKAIGRLLGHAGEPEPGPAFVDACAGATGGNPFLLGELVRQLRVEEVAATDANADQVASLHSSAIVHSVLLRVARLPPEATAFARAAAVLGDGSEARDVTAVADLEAEAAARAHGALVDAEILTADPQPAFVHPLVRSTIYEELPVLERGRWHGRAARVLAKSGAGEGDVARQLLLTEAGSDPWVRDRLESGGKAALHRGAPDVASRLLRRARREAVEPRNDPELLLVLGEAEFAARGVDGLGALEEALSAAAGPEARTAVALELGRALHAIGDHPRAASMYGAVLRSLEGAKPDLRRLIRAHFVYTALQDATTFADAFAELGEAVDELGDGGPADDIIRACMALGTAAAGAAGAPELAEEALRDGWLIAERTPALGFAATALVWSDELPRAAEVWDRALAEGRRVAERPWISFAACFRSHVAYRMGELELAEVHARDALEASETWALLPPDPAAFLCDALVEQGRVDEAEAALETSGYDHSLPERQGYTVLLFSRARLHAAHGRSEEAIADLRELGRRVESLTILNPAAFWWRSSLAELLMTTSPDEARELAETELERARAFGAPRAVGIALRAVALLSRGDDQIALLREAVAVLDRSHARLELTRATIELGSALRRQGSRVDARDRLREGLERAAELGAGGLFERARGELVAAGAKPRRDPLRGRDALTASEARVAGMAVAGASNREIAQELFVSLRTVETHLTHTYQKLDISRRAELPDALERYSQAKEIVVRPRGGAPADRG